MLKEGNFTQNNNSAVIAQKAENKTEEKPAIRLKPIKGWNDIIENFKTQGKIMLYTNLMNTTATEVNDMTGGIVFQNGITPFGRSILDKPESVNELTKIVSMELGKTMQVRYIDAKHPEESRDIVGEITKEIDMPVNVIDE